MHDEGHMKGKKTCKVPIHNFAVLILYICIYICLVAHLYRFLTVYIGLGVVAIDTGFSGTKKNLQVGVSPPLPEKFFYLSVLEKLQWVSHEFSGSLHKSLFSILNWICMWKQITLRQLQCQLIKKLLHCLGLQDLFKKDNEDFVDKWTHLKDSRKLENCFFLKASHSVGERYWLLHKLNSLNHTPFLSCWTVHSQVSHTLSTRVHLYPFLPKMRALNRYPMEQ